MAWSGSPGLIRVSDRIAKVRGLSLAAGASGLLGLSEHTTPYPTGFVTLGEYPEWKAYRDPHGTDVGLNSSVTVVINAMTDVAAAVPLTVTVAGENPGNFAITVKNPSSGASPDLDITVIFH